MLQSWPSWRAGTALRGSHVHLPAWTPCPQSWARCYKYQAKSQRTESLATAWLRRIQTAASARLFGSLVAPSEAKASRDLGVIRVAVISSTKLGSCCYSSCMGCCYGPGAAAHLQCSRSALLLDPVSFWCSSSVWFYDPSQALELCSNCRFHG